MRIDELFDKKVQWKWLVSPAEGEDISTAAFTVSGKTYTVDFFISNLESFVEVHGGLPLEVQELLKRDPDVVDAAFYLQKAGGGQTWELTGTGNQFLVLSTVINIIETFMSMSRGSGVEYLHLSAKEPSRQKLYDRLVSKLPHNKVIWTDDGDKRYLVGV